MAEETTTETGTGESGGISESELRSMFRSEVKSEMDERGLTKENIDKLGLLDSLESMFEKHKGNPEELVGKISDIFDSKLKGVSTGSGESGGNGRAKRTPRINIFG